MNLPNLNDPRPDEAPATLSPAAHARKQQMLHALQREVSARGRRRLAARAALVAAPMLALGVAGVLVLQATNAPAPFVVPHPLAGATPESAQSDAPAIAIGSDTADPDDSVAANPLPRSHSITISAAPDHTWDVIPRARPVATSLIRPAAGNPDVLDRARYQGHAAIPPASDAQLAVGLRAAGRAAGVVRTPERVLILPDQPNQPG